MLNHIQITGFASTLMLHMTASFVRKIAGIGIPVQEGV